MNAFERKMAEKLSLIMTLVLDINNRSEELTINFDVHGASSFLNIYSFETDASRMKRNAPCKENGIMFCMRGYFDADWDTPRGGISTLDQITHALHQIRHAVIEGRFPYESTEYHPATDTEHTATTGVDERNGTHGALLTEPAQLCHGSLERTGGQSAGSIPSMA